MQKTMETHNPAGRGPGLTEAQPAGAAYGMGYSNLFMELLERRSAARNAAHLLPLLRPGMEILDLGCGPGLITLGLARAVYPGRATGLDQDGEQVGTARANARLEDVENVCFVPRGVPGPALSQRLPGRRSLPRLPDALAPHPGADGGDRAGAQAGRHTQQPRHGRSGILHLPRKGR